MIEVVEPGLFTTVQDAQGRLGYWMVGVPPSGAMDSLSMRLVNRIVGNTVEAAGLECTVRGPVLRFEQPGHIALGGACAEATLDGHSVPWWSPVHVRAGSELRIGGLVGAGLRTYLAVEGGIDVEVVLGSRSTFTLGGFGGHVGRALAAGDRLDVGVERSGHTPSPLPPSAWPDIRNDWTLAVTEGPHSAPDFLTRDGLEQMLAARWSVQSHAARTGVRLDGPQPLWARSDGGEAGLHPSNLHDNGYAFGAVDLTGDTPVLLGPDGPSLGGFVCPLTVVAADRWKLGQLAPGDAVDFRLISVESARSASADAARVTRHLRPGPWWGRPATERGRDGGVLARVESSTRGPSLTVRRAGDEFVLVEFGEMSLDLALRARVHALETRLARLRTGPIVDLTAGVRSLLIHFDPDRLPQAELIEVVIEANAELETSEGLEIPSRVVHLPLSWEDPSTLEAIRRYMQVVRDDAPWCPSNLEFIRRINGLASVDDVKRTVFDADYLVLGLGDVYLGAPVATPLDPRHRLVTTKYNPARTWTPENAVGIGGAYLCIYGMEGPGGYQFVGRTVPVWYLDRPAPGMDPETPWLLRTFDQIRFHPVSAEQLTDLRSEAKAGRLEIEMEDTVFSLPDYTARLEAEAASIAEFRSRQALAFEEERCRWRASGEIA